MTKTFTGDWTCWPDGIYHGLPPFTHVVLCKQGDMLLFAPYENECLLVVHNFSDSGLWEHVYGKYVKVGSLEE